MMGLVSGEGRDEHYCFLSFSLSLHQEATGQARQRALTRTRVCCCLDLSFSASRPQEIKFYCLSYPVCDIFLQQLE